MARETRPAWSGRLSPFGVLKVLQWHKEEHSLQQVSKASRQGGLCQGEAQRGEFQDSMRLNFATFFVAPLFIPPQSGPQALYVSPVSEIMLQL